MFRITFAADGFINGSSYYEGVSRPLIGGSPSPPLQPKDDLLELLIQLGLEKYTTVFQEQEVQYIHTNTHTHAHTLTVFTSTHCLFHCCTCVASITKCFWCIFSIKPTSGTEFSERIWILWVCFFLMTFCFSVQLFSPQLLSPALLFLTVSIDYFNLLWHNTGQPRLHFLFPAPVVLFYIKTVPQLSQPIMFGHLQAAPSSNLSIC